MDDATQKLVDRVKDYPTITRLSHKTQIELIEQLRDALEAAQRPPVSASGLTDVLMEVTTWPRPSAHRLASDILARLSVHERPPVSPVLDAINDAREAVARGERPSIIIDTDDYPSERVA